MTHITARGVTRAFGKKQVLDGVDFDLGPGIHGLLGRNGVGKSTLLSIVAGQLRDCLLYTSDAADEEDSIN